MSKATHHLHHTYIRHRWQSTRFHQTRGHPRKAALFFSLHSLSSGSRLKRVPKVVRSRHHSLCTFALLHATHRSWDTFLHTHFCISHHHYYSQLHVRLWYCTMAHVFFALDWMFALRYTTDHSYCQKSWHCCKNVWSTMHVVSFTYKVFSHAQPNRYIVSSNVSMYMRVIGNRILGFMGGLRKNSMHA